MFLKYLKNLIYFPQKEATLWLELTTRVRFMERNTALFQLADQWRNLARTSIQHWQC